jgi:hypothetical protein
VRVNYRAWILIPVFLPVALFLFACSGLGYCFLFVGSILSDIGDIDSPPTIKSIFEWAKGGGK